MRQKYHMSKQNKQNKEVRKNFSFGTKKIAVLYVPAHFNSLFIRKKAIFNSKLRTRERRVIDCLSKKLHSKN